MPAHSASDRPGRAAGGPARSRRSRLLLPAAALVAATPYGSGIDARRAAQALELGLSQGGRPPSDLLSVDPVEALQEGLPGLLAGCGFDERLHQARALIILAERLDPANLAGSVPFELATRARQGGVPAWAVARTSLMGPFEQRILDLQAVLQARSTRALAAAGRRLAKLL